MTLTNSYCTLTDLKNRIDQALPTDATRDAYMEQMIEAASRRIDGYCLRRFYAATETHYFRPEHSDLLFVPDLLTVTTLKTDEDGDRTYEITWATTDYDLEPYDAPYASPPGPYTMISITPNGNYTFPRIKKGVQIVGSWGFAATTPDAINEACVMLSHRLYKRKDAVFGVAGANQFGTISMKVPVDADIEALLAPYRRVL